MLTDSFNDFTDQVKEPSANLSLLLADLEADLHQYASEPFDYNRQVFPLLRKAARWHVTGKLPWEKLNAVSIRLCLCYVALEGTEEALVEDLRAYIRAKPTINLLTQVEAICQRRGEKTRMQVATSIPNHTASITTSTGVVLRLVKG